MQHGYFQLMQRLAVNITDANDMALAFWPRQQGHTRCLLTLQNAKWPLWTYSLTVLYTTTIVISPDTSNFTYPWLFAQ